MHIYTIGGFSALGLAIKHSEDQSSSHNHNNLVGFLRENLIHSLGSNVSILDIFLGKHLSEISKKFKLLKIDFKIIKCLLINPRMKYLDIAKKVSASQRTVIRKIEKLQSNHVIVNFSIIHNPSKMKGYNYFSVIVKTDIGIFLTNSILVNNRIAQSLGEITTYLQYLRLLELKWPMTPGKLAELTGLTTGGITVVLDRLEKAKYIRQERNPNDRRSISIVLIPRKIVLICMQLIQK
jgi:DNA-binding MarR family transcriptional regulator